MVARVGSDLFGPATIENFKKLGIDATHVKQVEGVSSGVAPIFVEPSGQNRIFVVKGANDELKPADVDAAADLLKAVDCIVLQFEIPLETVYYTVAFARKSGIRCILNPAPGQPIDFKAVEGLDYFVPNESEAETITGMPVKNVEDAKKCAEKLLGYGIQPRHYYARRQWLAAGGKGRHGALAGVSGEEHRQHWRRRRLYRQLRRLPRRRASRTGGRPARQPVCRTLNHRRRDAEIFLRSRAIRCGVGGAQQILTPSLVSPT